MKLDLADIFVVQPSYFDAVIQRRNVERRGTPFGGKNLNVGAYGDHDQSEKWPEYSGCNGL